jgi:hypothetical protein
VDSQLAVGEPLLDDLGGRLGYEFSVMARPHPSADLTAANRGRAWLLAHQEYSFSEVDALFY